MRVVIVLGAGSSAPFRVPTLRHLFQDSAARAYLKANPGFWSQLQDVFWGPRGLDLNSSHKGLTAEEVLTVVRDYERRPLLAHTLPIPDVDEFKRHLFVLAKHAVYTGKSSQGRFLNPLITYAKSNWAPVTWASFNWDCIFEASYYYSGGTSYPARCNPKVVVPLRNWINGTGTDLFLKLHGGVNWWYEQDEIHYLPFGRSPNLDNKWRDYSEGHETGAPVLLEPSFYKYEDPVYDLLKSQWERFIDELLKAELVVIIGYSLPEADPEARFALTTGFQGNPDSRFVVIDSQDWTHDRYERLFGTTRLESIRMRFEDIAEDMGTEDFWRDHLS